MDIAYYINTGIVEQYALGLLNEADKHQFETLLPLYPELQQELLSLQTLLPSTGQDGDIPPPVSFDNLKYKYTDLEPVPVVKVQKKSCGSQAEPVLSIMQRPHTYIDVDKGIVIALVVCVSVAVVCICLLVWILMQ